VIAANAWVMCSTLEASRRHLIQRVGHRDTQAIQAKLDELLHVQAAARNELTRIDEQEPEEIEKHRHEARRHD
jgi:low affinity Fe/Cu permease